MPKWEANNKDKRKKINARHRAKVKNNDSVDWYTTVDAEGFTKLTHSGGVSY
jgi:hypothetical protein